MHRCLLFVGIFAGCAQDDAQVDTALQPLVVRCAHPDLAAGAWRCGEARTIECTHHEGGNEAAIYVDGGEACVDLDYQLSDPGPYLPGEHVIVVQRGDEAVCESVLTVVDTTPPTITSRDVQLWSPNHKWHDLRPTDCADIQDACDPTVEAHFTWVTSDEAADGNGDGNTHPDIELGCDTLRLRAERTGGGDGRVYHVGVVARDDAGHTTEGTCTVFVPHDQGGTTAADSGEAVRVEVTCD
jgi:hypothetical protein